MIDKQAFWQGVVNGAAWGLGGALMVVIIHDLTRAGKRWIL